MGTMQNQSEASHILWAAALSGVLCGFLWLALDAPWWLLVFVFLFMTGQLFKSFRKAQAESKVAYGAVEVKDAASPGAADVAPKFCSECGTPVSGGKFCRECGTRLPST